MWPYETTSKSMEPLYHPVVHPFTNQKPLMGIARAQAKRCKTSQNWVNILIFDRLIFIPFHF